MENKWSNFNFENSVKQVFGNAKGEELLEFMVDAFVMRLSYRKGEFDATAFAEGEKNMVMTIKHLLEKGAEEQ